jgi:cytochrome b pre-mRNA-processing protein 3
MILDLFRRSRPEPSVERVYGDIVAAARNPVLYASMGVPDTVMGRFEALALHVCLVLRRLAKLPSPSESLAQEIVDRFFADLDSALREIGIGDVSVPKKVKKLGQAFYGRAQAYDQALQDQSEATALEAALCRNVLDRPDEPGMAVVLAQYVRALVNIFDVMDMEGFLGGEAIRKQGVFVSQTLLQPNPAKEKSRKAKP